MQKLLLCIMSFLHSHIFSQSSYNKCSFISSTRQMYCGKSGNLFCHGDESTFCRHHLSRSTSTRLSVFNTTPVSACPPTHTSTHIFVCAAGDARAHIWTSNATKNNLAIHHAPLLPSSCHPDWQPRSGLMRQQNKASINTHYYNHSLWMCCLNPNVMHLHALMAVCVLAYAAVHMHTRTGLWIYVWRGDCPVSTEVTWVTRPSLIGCQSSAQRKAWGSRLRTLKNSHHWVQILTVNWH